jgi:creatinine amidohydrolase
MEHHEYCDTAVIGNPFRATKEKGLRMFDAMAGHLRDFVFEVRDFEVEITHSDFKERAWSEA